MARPSLLPRSDGNLEGAAKTKKNLQLDEKIECRKNLFHGNTRMETNQLQLN
jgi:hypothetical protein